MMRTGRVNIVEACKVTPHLPKNVATPSDVSVNHAVFELDAVNVEPAAAHHGAELVGE